MSGLVPQAETIEEVYSDPSTSASAISSAHLTRWKGLLANFSSTYGHKPDFVARSPGRVNIIGEHIDYSLFNVLPMAVVVDVLVAVKVIPSSDGDPSIRIANVHPEKFPTRKFTIPKEKDVDIDASKHEWTNYFKAGLRGALQFLRTKYKLALPASMELLVDGNVPAGGGLSSSAAFVCASALAVMKANEHDVSKQDLLDLAIVSERAVGVYSGGMDQAASIFSEHDHLLYCRFYPAFHAEHVPVPKSDPEMTFLVAQSYVTANKHVTAPKHYNLRVVECTLAAVVLAKLHDVVLNPDHSSLGFSLRNFQQELMRKEGRLDDPIEYQVDSMVLLTEETLDKTEGYTREEIGKLLDISVGTLEQTYMSKFPVQAEKFQLRSRALHVFKEARRVLDFKATLAHAHGLDDHKLKYLGQLMNETQTSCRDVYDCSCAEIDEICEIARSAGAYGSRLTGAGWGGCTVHLVPEHSVERVTEALKREYYFKKFPDIEEEKLEEAIVISKPSQGSYLITGAAIG